MLILTGTTSSKEGHQGDPCYEIHQKKAHYQHKLCGEYHLREGHIAQSKYGIYLKD